MKFRQCFVSNSSSSSFVIAVTPRKACEHCGRGDPDFVTLFQSMCEADRGGESTLDHTTTSYLESLREAIQHSEEILKDLLGKPDWQVTQYNSTVKADRKYHTERVEEETARLRRVEVEQSKGHEVLSISISYHNPSLQAFVKSNLESGAVTLIEGEITDL